MPSLNLRALPYAKREMDGDKPIDELYRMAFKWACKKYPAVAEEEKEDFASFCAIQWLEGYDKRNKIQWLWWKFRNKRAHQATACDVDVENMATEEWKEKRLTGLSLVERFVAALILQGFTVQEIAALTESEQEEIEGVYGNAAAFLSRD